MANDVEVNELRIRVQKVESENMRLRRELNKTKNLLKQVIESRDEEYVPALKFDDPAVV